jgi:hypothetical protein
MSKLTGPNFIQTLYGSRIRPVLVFASRRFSHISTRVAYYCAVFVAFRFVLLYGDLRGFSFSRSELPSQFFFARFLSSQFFNIEKGTDSRLRIRSLRFVVYSAQICADLATSVIHYMQTRWIFSVFQNIPTIHNLSKMVRVVVFVLCSRVWFCVFLFFSVMSI